MARWPARLQFRARVAQHAIVTGICAKTGAERSTVLRAMLDVARRHPAELARAIDAERAR
jgi:hypothetical protein